MKHLAQTAVWEKIHESLISALLSRRTTKIRNGCKLKKGIVIHNALIVQWCNSTIYLMVRLAQASGV